MELSLDLLEEALAAAGLNLDEDVSLYSAYSGRAMYGRSCFGLAVANMVDVCRFLIGLAMAEPDVAMEMVGDTRTDSLGRGVIAYWPGWTLDDDAILELAEAAEGDE